MHIAICVVSFLQKDISAQRPIHLLNSAIDKIIVCYLLVYINHLLFIIIVLSLLFLNFAT